LAYKLDLKLIEFFKTELEFPHNIFIKKNSMRFFQNNHNIQIEKPLTMYICKKKIENGKKWKKKLFFLFLNLKKIFTTCFVFAQISIFFSSAEWVKIFTDFWLWLQCSEV
jgi:hypothetical protein